MALPEIREALAPVRSSLKAQITGEMLEAPQIGDLGSDRIEMGTSGPGEAVVLAWVIADRNSGASGEGTTKAVLTLGGAMLVLARDMKEQRAVQVRGFGERLFDADAVIANSRVRAMADREQVSEVAAKAEPDCPNRTITGGMVSQRFESCG